MAVVKWWKGEKSILIDDANKVATDSFTKKGYGPEKVVPPVATKAVPPVTTKSVGRKPLPKTEVKK